MFLRLRMCGLACVAVGVAAGALALAQGQQAQSANAAASVSAAASAALYAPAVAAPESGIPQMDDSQLIPWVPSPDKISNLSLPSSPLVDPVGPTSPDVAMPQNRVLPANVANVGNMGNMGSANRASRANNAGARGSSSDSERARPAYSATWLVDGVQQLEAESRQRYNPDARQTRQPGVSDEKTGSSGDDENETARASAAQNSAARASMTASAPASAPASATADNALAAYLDKWVTTPEGAAAVRAALAREAGGGAPVSANAASGASANASASASASASANATTAPFSSAGGAIATAQAAPASPAAAAVNPYIDDMFQPQMDTKGLDIVLPPPPMPPPPETPKTAALPASDSATPDTLAAPAATAPVDASHLKLKPIMPPPAEPVVDEKKYFPQLQRF